RGDGGAGGLPAVRAGPAAGGGALDHHRRVALLRAAPVRSHLLGTRRPLVLRLGGTARQLVLPPSQDSAVGHREHRDPPHPSPASPDSQLPAGAGAARQPRASGGAAADLVGEPALRAADVVGRAGAEAGAVQGRAGASPRLVGPTRTSAPPSDRSSPPAGRGANSRAGRLTRESPRP